MTIKILRNCLPAIANMVLHLKEWIALSPENETGEIDDVTLDDEYDDILEQFLEYANETVSRHGATLILLHYPLRYSFDENGKMSVLYDKESFELLKNRCEQNGILIADCTEKFEKMYAEDHVLPNGFVNTVWGAGHLNKYGHEACARALAETIRSLEEEE